jgi:hypothetical protein
MGDPQHGRFGEPAAGDVHPERQPVGARVLELADVARMEAIRARVDAVVKDPATAEALSPTTATSANAPVSTTSTSTPSTGRTWS